MISIGRRAIGSRADDMRGGQRRQDAAGKRGSRGGEGVDEIKPFGDTTLMGRGLGF